MAKEAEKDITEGIPASTVPFAGGKPFGEGKALEIRNARLQLQGIDSTIQVIEGMDVAEFTVDLEPGKTKLKTWFITTEGSSLGLIMFMQVY